MKNFEKRRDRFDFFESFENPLLNLTFKLTTVDFLAYCKKHNHPPFHFFLYHLMKSLHESENFHYRIFQNEVIKIDKIIASYTAMGPENLFNYTRFEYSSEMREFIERSLTAKKEIENSTKLMNTGVELGEREIKNYVFITSIPWLDFTSIQHPVFKFKSADIPSIAWGKFSQTNNKVEMPFSVQAHHGFVDAFHIHELSERIKSNLEKTCQE